MLGSRILPEELVQGTRRRILDELWTQPGLGFTQLLTGLALSVGTLGHHLYVLERFGLIRSLKVGRTRRYYLLHEGPPNRRAHALLLDPVHAALHEWIRSHPGQSQRAVAQSQGRLSRQGVAYRLRQLVAGGLIRVEPQAWGRGNAYHAIARQGWATVPAADVSVSSRVPAGAVEGAPS